MKNRQVKLIAEDVWGDWKKAVENAKKSIVIFSPFISYRVIRLLENKNLRIKKGNISIITLFDIRNFLVHASSLKTIVSLLESRYKVKHLNNLHAKVLLVDGEILVLGSQNFTVKGGKKNRETSAKITIEDTYSDNEFIKKLKEWQDNALEIPLSVAKHWLEKIKPFINEITKLKEELILKGNDALKRINDEEEMYEKAKNGTIQDCENYLERYPDGKYVEEIKELLNNKKNQEQRESKSKFRKAKSKSKLRFKETDNRGNITVKIRPSDKGTAKVIRGGRLTIWEDKITKENIELTRLNQYPAFNWETQVLRFIRLVDKQIGISNTHFTDGQEEIKISTTNYKIHGVNFVQGSIADYNIKIYIRYQFLTFEIKFYFDGITIIQFEKPIKTAGFKQDLDLFEEESELNSEELEVELNEFLNSKRNIRKLIKATIENFKFKKGHKTSGHSLSTFLHPNRRYFVNLITFENQPIIVFHLQD